MAETIKFRDFVICCHCEQTLLELDEGSDPTKNWVCDECFLQMVEPNRETGERYCQ